MNDITRWLGQLGLDRYADAFRENDVDEEVLLDLSEADLVQLGISSLGHRKKLLRAIAELQASGCDRISSVLEPMAEPLPVAQSGGATAAGERRQLAVMFCDLVGSTRLARQLDPEDLRDIITSCQQAWSSAVERHDGFVARYMGDGILAYFGYPQAHEDDGESAVHAALDVVQATEDVNIGLNRADVELAVRVGIATGPAVVGDMLGDGASRENPVVGETPNLASRLLGIADPNTVVISDLSRQLAGDVFYFEDLGLHALKGIAEPVHAWRVEGDRPAESRFEAGRMRRLTPLVGREHELGLLLDRWEQASSGEGQVVFLSGEPGVGKSRVSQALHEQLNEEPHMRIGYQCSPHHTNSALYPFITRIERDAGFEPTDAPSERLRKLEALVEELPGAMERHVGLIAALLSVPVGERYPTVDLSTQRQKEELLHVLALILRECGRGRPLILLFEDAHWADATSLELLDIVVEQTQRLRGLLLITARPEFESRWGSHTHVTSLTLNRLNRRLVAKMIRRVADPVSLPSDVVAQIAVRCDGNPLYVEELTRSVLESRLENRQELEAKSGAKAALSIPATLRDSLMARLDRVPMARDVAQCAAVIGREFTRDFLVWVLQASVQDVSAALDRLVEADIVFKRGATSDGVFAFKHALLRDAAYESQLKSQRRELHNRIAERLETWARQGSTIDFALLAHHYTMARKFSKAIPYWHKAGEHAARQSANREAVEHFRRGIELLSDLEEAGDWSRQELDIQVALGSVLEATEGFAAPSVGRAHNRAQQLCEQLGDTEQLTRVLYGLAHFHMVRAELATACRIGERCVELANELEDPGYLVDARLVLGGSLLCCGELDAARDHLESGLAQYGPRSDAPYAYCLALDTDVFGRSFLGHVLWMLGYPSRAQSQLREAIATATSRSDHFSSARAWAYHTMLNQFAHAPEDTINSAMETIAICKEHHFEYYGAWGQFMHAWAIAQLDTGDAEIVELKRALDRLLRTGAELRHPYYLGLLAECLGTRGKQAEGLALIEEALETMARTGERWVESELYRVRGRLRLDCACTPVSEAEDDLRRAVRCAGEQKAISFQLRAAVALTHHLRDRRQCQEATQILGSCYTKFTEGFDGIDLREAKALLEELG